MSQTRLKMQKKLHSYFWSAFGQCAHILATSMFGWLTNIRFLLPKPQKSDKHQMWPIFQPISEQTLSNISCSTNKCYSIKTKSVISNHDTENGRKCIRSIFISYKKIKNNPGQSTCTKHFSSSFIKTIWLTKKLNYLTNFKTLGGFSNWCWLDGAFGKLNRG